MDKLTEEELANLSQLLMSEYEDNIELGLTILETNMDRVPVFHRELILLNSLHDNPFFKQQSKGLLALHYSDQMLEKWAAAFKLLHEGKSISSDTAALKKMIKSHEDLRPKLQVFLDNNSKFALPYYSIARQLHLNIKAHFELAQTYYRICLNRNPNHENCLYCLAYLLADYPEHAAEAIELYERVIILNPKSDGGYNNIGHAYDKHFSEYKKASEYYTKAHELAPKDTRYMRNLSKVLLRLKEDNYQEKAKELLILATECSPETSANWKHLGDYYWLETKEYDLCKKTYLGGLQKSPKDALLLSSLAEYYNSIVYMYDLALEVYRKSVACGPTRYSLVSIVDLLVNKFKLLDEAKEHYVQFIKMSSIPIEVPNSVSDKKWSNFLSAEKLLLKKFPDLT